MMLQTFRASKLLELRQKTRIFIPKGRAMMGVLDETKTLEYGEVFVQYSNNRLSNISHVVKGKVVVAKNPCLHPGDVRVLGLWMCQICGTWWIALFSLKKVKGRNHI
jgi:RNA-dependent RNA polymerase